MNNFKIQQLEMLRQLGDVLSFSYDLQAINYLAKHKPKQMVKCAENFYKWQIEDISETFVKQKAKILFIAGGSSAGKTTSSYNIKRALKKHGKIAHVISMDDFFVNREDTPLLPDGSYDFENVTAVDLPYFTKFTKAILKGEEALLPHFDFVTGTRDKYTSVKLKKDEVLIIEGLHALNPMFQKGLERKSYFKVFLSAISNFTVGNELVIDARDIRLMRRLLRDYYTRGVTVTQTVEMWKNVRQGEEKFILPYRNTADYLLNTTHMYEPLLYDKFLSIIIKNEGHLTEVNNLINIFKKTGTFSEDFIPKNSLIQEFIPKKISD